MDKVSVAIEYLMGTFSDDQEIANANENLLLQYWSTMSAKEQDEYLTLSQSYVNTFGSLT